MVLLLQGAARLTLTLWRRRAHEQIKWPYLCVDAIVLLLFVAIARELSQSALDAYTYFYSTVPADIPLDARKVSDFNQGLDKSMFDSARLAAWSVWVAGLETAICIYKVWKAFDVEELDHEIAVHEEHRRHEPSDALR